MIMIAINKETTTISGGNPIKEFLSLKKSKLIDTALLEEKLFYMMKIEVTIAPSKT